MSINLIDDFISYISTVRRYSQRTMEIYRDILNQFLDFCGDDDLLECLNSRTIRSYEVDLLSGNRGLAKSPRTVNLHLSVLSAFCKYLIKEGKLNSNPVKTVARPKMDKRLPEFYRNDSVSEYFADTEHSASQDELDILKSFGVYEGDETQLAMYKRRLNRAIVSFLFTTGIRRSELINLPIGNVDFGRKVAKVKGKGDKMREIPLVNSICQEISLYLQSVETMVGRSRTADEPLFVTEKGRKLYPVYVDRVIKEELGQVASITGKKSPHVLRHTLATELLNDGSDLNSIKELLGHSSLAATQVYTHNSIEKLRKTYINAHPRAKNGGKYGD